MTASHPPAVPVGLRPVTPEEQLAFLAGRPGVSFLQCPSWAKVKREWRHELLGWTDADDRLVGSAVVLYRKVPGVRRFLAYLPEGPVIDWSGDLEPWLDPLVERLRGYGALGITMGPPVVTRRWHADTVKAGLAAPGTSRLADLPADEREETGEQVIGALTRMGWLPPEETGGFAAGQPRYVYQLPLAGKTPQDLLAGFNQQWRRNIRKAEQAGVLVARGDEPDLAAFHDLYVGTAARDKFIPRPLEYFQRMWRALQAEHPDRIRLYLATHGADLLAATIMVTVGDHAWYSYGASGTAGRELRPSNAIQWRMIQDALALGARVYDLRGITDTLDPEDHLAGLLQFKLGVGGSAVELVGEWSLPVNRLLFAGYRTYVRRRG